MHGELIGWLRGMACGSDRMQQASIPYPDLTRCRQAADALETLTAKVAQLEAERDGMREAVLEEAAKVADDYDGSGMDYGSGYELGDASCTARDIARIIRDLREHPHD